MPPSLSPCLLGAPCLAVWPDVVFRLSPPLSMSMSMSMLWLLTDGLSVCQYLPSPAQGPTRRRRLRRIDRRIRPCYVINPNWQTSLLSNVSHMNRCQRRGIRLTPDGL